jgi:hypothetical protein
LGEGYRVGYSFSILFSSGIVREEGKGFGSLGGKWSFRRTVQEFPVSFYPGEERREER